MKYYFIAGEASGDLHSSSLMQALKAVDAQARFRFVGGDLMADVAGRPVIHYRKMAYMGIVPVLLHLRTILRNMALCKKDIEEWQPNVVVLVDYPSFNLRIARFVHSRLRLPVFYYISPKIWAWKEWRIKSIRRYVDEMFCILPFETDFYKGHNYPVHYVGNPTADEVRTFREAYKETKTDFCRRWQLDETKPIIALLAGSRLQEIKDNLPAMVDAASRYTEYQMVLAGAPSVDTTYYERFIAGTGVMPVSNDTFALLSHASAALVTSGTATLETALFDVPQVVCYATPLPHLVAFLRKRLLHVSYVSLVNLIAGKQVVAELVADTFGADNIAYELEDILPGGDGRKRMLGGYSYVRQRLGHTVAPDNAAHLMYDILTARQNGKAR